VPRTLGAFCRALGRAPTIYASSRGTAHPCRSFPRQCHRLSCALGDSQVSAEPRRHRRACTAALRAPAPSSLASRLWELCGRSPHAKCSSAADRSAFQYRPCDSFFSSRNARKRSQITLPYPLHYIIRGKPSNHDVLRKESFRHRPTPYPLRPQCH
jgi:hypothetical protein